MAHRIYFDENHIMHVELSGELDLAGMEAYLDEYEATIDSVKPAGTYGVLVDTSGIAKVDLEARRLVVNRMENNSASGVFGIFGATPFIKHLINFILRATLHGRQNVKYFDSRDEAMSWIQTQIK
jgi:hypothetical protein